MEHRHIAFILVLFLMISETISKRNFIIKIKKFDCVSKTEVLNITCSETKSNRVAGFNIFVTMTEDVYAMRYDLEVKYKRKNGHWENFFKFTNIDVCEFLAAKFTAPILLIARNLMRKFSNYPDECPFMKDTVYYVQRMKMDPEQFPPYFPDGEFEASGLLYNEKYTFCDFVMGFLVVSKKHKAEIA